MSTTVNWLSKGTLAVVTLSRHEPGRFSVVNGFPPPYVGLWVMFLMGPDGHEALTPSPPLDALDSNTWKVWVQHPDTIREAREAWLAAGGGS